MNIVGTADRPQFHAFETLIAHSGRSLSRFLAAKLTFLPLDTCAHRDWTYESECWSSMGFTSDGAGSRGAQL